jgi:hypothetical protein
MDDVWCSNQNYSEQQISDNIKRVKNNLKQTNINNNVYNNYLKCTNINQNQSINSSYLFDNENYQNLKNSNSNNNNGNNNNNYFQLPNNQMNSYNNSNNNNLINFQQYPLQFDSQTSTSEDTMSNNNYNIINISRYFNQPYNNNIIYFNNNTSNYIPINNMINNCFYDNINNNNLFNEQNNENLLNGNSNDYVIDINNIIQGFENRTSIKINYIPIKYKSEDLIKEIDTKLGLNLENKNYDLFYLPMSYYNTRNFGYAFLNFIDPLCIIEFYNKFQKFKWKKNNKGCQVTYAKYQGKNEFSEHLLPNSGEAKKPIYFNVNKSKIRIKIPKKYIYDVKKGRKDALEYIDFCDK